MGPCCVTFDGKIRCTKKWGDGKGCSSTDPDEVVYECNGCRELLARPDVDEDGLDSIKVYKSQIVFADLPEFFKRESKERFS